MRLRALAPVLALLDQLLCVVPCAARDREHHGHELAGEDRAGQERAEGLGLQEEPHDDRREHRQRARRQQLADRGLRADVDDARVVGLLGVVHDPRVVPELLADLHHHLPGSPAHRADGQ